MRGAQLILACGLAAGLLPAQTAADLFDGERLVVHPSDWAKLQQNYQDNTYYPANLTWRSITIANVGIRSKGRTSRRNTKPGLRVDMDRFEEQRFLGLKSFLLDNNIQDYTMIKERLAMLLYRRMGLPAPRESHCRLFVNNTYLGVYTIVESTDKLALKNWFREDEGYLYEY